MLGLVYSHEYLAEIVNASDNPLHNPCSLSQEILEGVVDMRKEWRVWFNSQTPLWEYSVPLLNSSTYYTSRKDAVWCNPDAELYAVVVEE